MSEQPNNLQEAPECPTDDEVLAKRDAEIARLRKALTKADTLLGDTLDSDFGMWSRNDVSNLRRPVWAAYQLVHDALTQSSPDKPSRVGDGIAAAPTQEKLLAAMRWIDTFEPETTAAAEAKFGFKLFS